MSLDKLKESWKMFSEDLVNSRQMEEKKLLNLLKNRASDAIQKVSKNLLIEFVVSLILYVLLIWFVIQNRTQEINVVNYTALGILLLVFVLSIGFMLYKYVKIIKGNFQVDSLLNQLENKVKLVSGFIKVYKISALIGYPLGALVGILLFSTKEIEIMLFAISFIISLVIGYFLIHPVLKWYIKKMYGKHLEEVKNCLSELKTNLTE